MVKYTITCPTTAAHPTNSAGQFVNFWWDNTPISTTPTSGDLAASARRAARYFGNSTQASNVNAQYVIATPHGHNTADFTNGSICAWHWYTGWDSYGGYLPYTDLPYMPDNPNCGMNRVHAGSAGYLDGVTLVASHEYAESVTDPFMNAWMDENGASGETGDKCHFKDPGYATDMSFLVDGKTMWFPVSPNWSNAVRGCVWWSY